MLLGAQKVGTSPKLENKSPKLTLSQNGGVVAQHSAHTHTHAQHASVGIQAVQGLTWCRSNQSTRHLTTLNRVVVTCLNCINLPSRALGIKHMPITIRLREIWLPEVCHTGMASLTCTKCAQNTLTHTCAHMQAHATPTEAIPGWSCSSPTSDNSLYIYIYIHTDKAN